MTSADVHGEAVALACADSDAALKALLARLSRCGDIEVRGARLEEAFLILTGDRRPRGRAVNAVV